MRWSFLSALVVFPWVCASAADDPAWCNQFRGPRRDGVYDSRGLLASWPEGGPPMLWQRAGIGQGYSSPIITPAGIFITGDRAGEVVISALTADGSLRWEMANGAAWTGSYPGARATCTYHRGRLYHLNAHGRLLCLDPANGQELWAVPLLDRFRASNIQWGISECLLVDGNRVFVMVGGPETLMVALDATTGKLLWHSPPLRFQRAGASGGKAVTDKAGYTSPVRLAVGERELLATASARHFVLVDAATGELVWQAQMEVRYDVIGAIPVVRGTEVFFSAPECGGFLYRVSLEDGRVMVEKRWQIDLDNCHGAMVLAGETLFGSGYRKNRSWAAVEWATGAVRATLGALPIGSAVWADGRVYAQCERGTLLLLEPAPEALIERGRMVLTESRRIHLWAHPVIHAGRLYLRVDDTLRCHDLRAGGE